jgi:hypothetical protein
MSFATREPDPHDRTDGPMCTFSLLGEGFEHRRLPRLEVSTRTCGLTRENVVTPTTRWRLWDYVRTPPGPLTWGYVAAECEEWPNSSTQRSAAGSAGEVMGLRSDPLRARKTRSTPSISQSDHDLASSMTLVEVLDCSCGIAERVRPVYGGGDLSRFKEVPENR